jgi:hypothetical protein
MVAASFVMVLSSLATTSRAGAHISCADKFGTAHEQGERVTTIGAVPQPPCIRSRLVAEQVATTSIETVPLAHRRIIASDHYTMIRR